MSLVVKVNGTAIADAIPPESVQSQHRAQGGDAGFGGFTIDDPDALITTIGHNAVTVEETACSQPRLFTGYLTERDIGRSIDRGMVAGADARAHDVTMVDLNAVFNFRTLTYSPVKRPEETIADRLTWLLGHWSLASFIEDTGHVTYPTSTMDAADYTGATAAAVLDDMVSRVQGLYTYFAFWDSVAAAVGLYFGPEGTGIGESSLYISNDLADIDGTTTFAPDSEAKLARTPEEVYSEVIVEYSHGTKRIYRSRPATVATYGIARGTTIQRPYTGRATTAQAQADTWLTKHSVERDQITTAILVPPESAGLAIAGQRVNVRFTHLDDYADWTSMRIVTSDVQPVDDTATLYRIGLVLELPTLGAAPPATCETNSLAGIVPTANTNVPANIFGAGGQGNVIQDAAEATDGEITDPPVGGSNGAYYLPGTYSGAPMVLYREWVFDLDGAKSLSKVTVAANYYDGALSGNLDKAYIKLDSTKYDGTTYATGQDYDIWPDFNLGETGIPFVATWDFGGNVEASTLTFGFEYDTNSPEYVPKVLLAEIAACISDSDEEADLGPSQTSPVISTADPTQDDDANDGYQVGQTWVNTATGAVFTLTDATPGAAVWTPMAGTGDHGALTGLLDDDHTQYVLKTLGGKEVVSTVAASGATETLDLADGNVHDVTLTADCTLDFTGATNGVACSFTLVLRQDGTGGWTTTWPASVIWPGGTAPTLDETASTASVLTFFTLDGGTNWYGFATGGTDGGTPAATVTDETTWGIAPAVGSDTEYARQDHTHGTPPEPAPGGVGPILIEDTPAGSPLVFADLLQNEEGTDLLYADAV